MKYYVIREGMFGDAFVGTYSLDEMRARLANGELKETDRATESDGRSYNEFRKGPTANWITLGELIAKSPPAIKPPLAAPDGSAPTSALPASHAVPYFRIGLGAVCLSLLLHFVPFTSKLFWKAGCELSGVNESMRRLDKVVEENNRFSTAIQDRFARGNLDDAIRAGNEAQAVMQGRNNEFNRITQEIQTGLSLAKTIQISLEVLVGLTAVLISWGCIRNLRTRSPSPSSPSPSGFFPKHPNA